MRQLEVGLIDVKGSNERKTQTLSEELPARLQREIRGLEQKEMELHKEYQSNMSQLQEGVNRMKDVQVSIVAQLKDQG